MARPSNADRLREGRDITETQHVNEDRPQRPSAGRKSKLRLPGIKPGYVGYLAINKPGNIEQMIEDGWEFVYASSEMQDVLNSEDSSQMGSKYTIPAGDGFLYYGLQIRKDWYDEIMQERLAEVREIEDSMCQPTTQDLPTHGEAYIPGGSKRTLTTTINDYRK